MKNFKLLFTAIATFAITATLFSFNGKHATNEKKKFTNIVYFTYANTTMGGLTDPGNWTAATSSLCPSGTTNPCGISFDADQVSPSFALDAHGKPNSTVLSDASTDFSTNTGVHQFTAADNITYYRQ